MRSMPEKFAAPRTNEILIEPTIRLWWNSLPHGFFICSEQFSAASHATGLMHAQVELTEHQRKLFGDPHDRWQPHGRNDAIAQKTAFHQHAVGGQDRGPGFLR